MQNEFLTLTKALNVPLLAAADIDALNRLQKQWAHWSQRERQHAATRVAEEQQAAFTAFVENPTTETEQKLLVTADANLTGTRYATLRRACMVLRQRISAQAANLLWPVLERVLAALRAEHTRRRESAEPVMSSRDRHPRVIEVRRVLDYVESMANRVHRARSGNEDKHPMELADVLMSGANDLTPNGGK